MRRCGDLRLVEHAVQHTCAFTSCSFQKRGDLPGVAAAGIVAGIDQIVLPGMRRASDEVSFFYEAVASAPDALSDLQRRAAHIGPLLLFTMTAMPFLGVVEDKTADDAHVEHAVPTWSGRNRSHPRMDPRA